MHSIYNNVYINDEINKDRYYLAKLSYEMSKMIQKSVDKIKELIKRTEVIITNIENNSHGDEAFDTDHLEKNIFNLLPDIFEEFVIYGIVFIYKSYNDNLSFGEETTKSRTPYFHIISQKEYNISPAIDRSYYFVHTEKDGYVKLNSDSLIVIEDWSPWSGYIDKSPLLHTSIASVLYAELSKIVEQFSFYNGVLAYRQLLHNVSSIFNINPDMIYDEPIEVSRKKLMEDHTMRSFVMPILYRFMNAISKNLSEDLDVSILVKE